MKTQPENQTSAGVRKNQSLRKAIQILEYMTTLPTPARLQDIAKGLAMPESTLLRFLNTYIDFGYVAQDSATSCYYLTLRLAEMGLRSKANFPFQDSLTKYVRQIARTFNEAASLCIENDMQMVYIATEDGPERMLRTLQRIGRIGPMHATGVGKLHLMNYSDRQLAELEKKYGLPRYTDHTITTMEALKKEIARIRQQGYALDDEECEKGIQCVAAPVIDFSGKVVAGISLSAPISRLDKQKLEKIIQYVKNVGISASKELGVVVKN